MRITKVEHVAKGKYIVTREDGAFLCLYSREFKGLGFKEGVVCEEEQWTIGFRSVLTRGKKRIFHLLARKDYTISELRTKLVKENYYSSIIDLIIEYFSELGYVDDCRYVAKYYNYHKETKSRRIIEQKLKQKGVESNVIRDVIEEEAAENDAYEAARKLALKKYGNKTLTRKDYPKMVQFLMRKGFDYGLCKEVINRMFDNSEGL